MTKNEFFYEYQSALDKACEETRIKKNRVALVDYFQCHWEEALGKISGAELLKEGVEKICVDKPKGRKRK